jgi:hypothetical protein
MAEDYNNLFEKEQNIPVSKEAPVSDSKMEKIDVKMENVVESESSHTVEDAESKKPLEKTGEGFKSSKKSNIRIDSSDSVRQKQIDNILAEGLNDVFLEMDPKQQRIFKEEGEKTASKINIILSSAKIKIKNIIDLIKNWLKLIPKINPHFLEQEAKIKADKIIKLKK